MSKLNEEIKNKNKEIGEILQYLDNLEFDGSAIQGQILEKEKSDWYCSRFAMFLEDGVPGAINCYLQKLQSDSVNEFTRLYIMQQALSLQLKKK